MKNVLSIFINFLAIDFISVFAFFCKEDPDTEADLHREVTLEFDHVIVANELLLDDQDRNTSILIATNSKDPALNTTSAILFLKKRMALSPNNREVIT